uniref:Arf-GAP domain-containing protein n=1 Tax=Gadus morhua TaxID=8049 RepID=A0A8C5A299_GADMO
MTTRSEREKSLKLNEQHQVILAALLREDDNKYCADCEAKGPRWASWNLGVFICIRCAGIHRNLGVHISRVKSVNLDQWTSEQIQSIQDMGNTRARKRYEANLPESFRRPQTDQAVEFFIRDKYEKKKYFSKNVTNGGSVSTANHTPFTELRLTVHHPFCSDSFLCYKVLSFFTKLITRTVRNPCASFQAGSLDPASAPPQAGAGAALAGLTTSGSCQAELDLFGDGGGAKGDDPAKKTLSKDSILSLYGNSSQQSPNAGMYMGPSQMQFPVQAPAGYQGYPGMGGAPPSTVMGAMMGQGGAAMMAPNSGMMVGMTMPNGFMGNPHAGLMGVAPGMMGGPGGGAMPSGMMAAPGMYAINPAQQGQWSIGQMNQQMSGMALNGPGGAMAFGQPASGMGGWAASGQTMSTQLWK